MRINQLPSATEVAQNDVLAIDTSNGTYQVPRSVLAPSPYIADIPASQWSGSSGDYYITVSASNVTPSSILIPNYDEDSSRYLIGALWCVPGTGSFTIHTSVLPASTVKILVYFLGVMGEAQYQVLSDVYSKSQTNSLLGAKVNTSDIVDNLTSTETNKPGSANMLRVLNEYITGLLNGTGPSKIQSDLNNCKTVGVYTANKNQSSNIPSQGYFIVLVMTYNNTNDLAQIAIEVNTAATYLRTFHDGTTWTSWVRLDNDNIKTWTTSSATSSIGTASYSVNEATKICIVGYAAGANGTGNGTITLPTTIKSKFYTYSPLRGGGYLSAAENSNTITIADSVAWGVGQIVIPF